ncbi:MAG: PHB depolymerase family esterase [Caldimonas sp.]
MNSFFRKFLAASRRSSRNGLLEATEAVQRALHSATAAVTGAPAPVASTPKAPAPKAPDANRRASAEGGSAPAWRAAEAAVAPAVNRPGSARFDEGSFSAASGSRHYKLYEPAGFDGRTLPLIVMLHGCTQDPDDFALGTGMNELAALQGAFVLYPAQPPRSNASKCWNWFVPGDQRRGSGEPAVLAAMTRHVVMSHAIDPRRVFVAGLSAGGAMAAILAREYPDLFAAAGVHSGLPPSAAHDVASAFAAMKSGAPAPPRPLSGLAGQAMVAASPLRTPLAAWPSTLRTPQAGDAAGRPGSPAPGAAREAASGAPLIVFHGDADTTVNPLNAAHVVEAALGTAPWDVTRERVAAQAGQRGYTRTVYRPEGASTQAPSRAESWLVHEASHAWAGGNSAGRFTEPDGPDASREMLRFFSEHALVPAR